MTSATRKATISILGLLMVLTTAVPTLAQTNVPGPNNPSVFGSVGSWGSISNCNEQANLRRGYYCQVTNASGVEVMKWWACDATYLCNEGQRHKFYCVQNEPASGYNNYYDNSGIVNETRDRNTMIQKCISMAGNLIQATCRSANLNWYQFQH